MTMVRLKAYFHNMRRKRQMSTANKIQTLEAGGFDPNRVRALIYGESGVGKTVFASTWPRPVFLDAEDGMASVTLPVDRVRCDAWEDVFDVLQYLAAGDHNYETIVLDSLNEIQHFSMDYVVRTYPDRKST